MNTKLTIAIGTLIDFTLTTNPENFIEVLKENAKDFTDALQFIGDSDFENHIHSAHLALRKTCPAELETHVQSMANMYIALINKAWNDFEEDCSAMFDSFMEVSGIKNDVEVPASQDTEAINHLNACFATTPEPQGTWSF